MGRKIEVQIDLFIHDHEIVLNVDKITTELKGSKSGGKIKIQEYVEIIDHPVEIDRDEVFQELTDFELKDELRKRNSIMMGNEAEIMDAIETKKPHVNQEVQPEIMARFAECSHLLNEHQWNNIFCEIEKKTFQERRRLTEKYDRL